MKIRKHKNNRTFLITFSTRPASRTETHLNSDGTTRKVVTEGEFPLKLNRVWAIGSCWQSVRNAFLFGRDANNVATIVREAIPIATKFDGVVNICPV